MLARRMDARSELRVTLLLNIQRKKGDTTEADQLVRRFADRFWKPTGLGPPVRVCIVILEPAFCSSVTFRASVVAENEIQPPIPSSCKSKMAAPVLEGRGAIFIGLFASAGRGLSGGGLKGDTYFGANPVDWMIWA